MPRFSAIQMNFVTKILMVFILLHQLPSKLNAAERVDIFTVDVAVADRTQSSRTKAMKQGLAQVLVRASGVEASTNNEYIRSRMNKAQSFIQQFAYLKSTENPQQTPWILRLNFEPLSIQRLLTDAGLAIWGERRPVVLLWIAQQQGYQRHIIGLGGDNAAKIEKIATSRAIPIQFPLMDLEDSTQVELTDIWGRFSSPIVKASRRYKADIILFGRVYQRNDRWQADWQLILENERSGWKDVASAPEEIYAHLFSQLGQRLCTKYCVVATQTADNKMRLRVQDLDSFLQAASAEKYLESLLPVRDINLLELKDNQALFLLRLVSRQKTVLEAIALDSALSPLPSQPPLGLEKRIYNYRWTP